jgi:uncharacterized OB-fold protein
MSRERDQRHAGFDGFLDAVAAGAPDYLVCPAGHASLPRQRVCPECGERDLGERQLPTAGTVEAHTVVHVPAPAFGDDAPYATALAAFGPLELTGVVRGVDPVAVECGLPVELTVGERETDGARLLVFRADTGAGPEV